MKGNRCKFWDLIKADLTYNIMQIIKVIQRFYKFDKDMEFDLGGQDACCFQQEELIDIISKKGYKCESPYIQQIFNYI